MRVMATGLGMVTAVGNDTESTWAALTAGKPGIGPVHRLGLSDLPVRIAGEADLDHEEDWVRDPESDRGVVLALRAAREAVARSGLSADGSGYDPERIGLVVATSQGATRGGEDFHRQWRSEGLRRADVRKLLSYPLNSVGDAVARHTGFRGPRATVSNACAAGGVAIGYALELLWGGDADAVLCGGVDPLSMLSFSGFNCLSALDPQGCAPYTRSEGLSLGEGAGFVVLERADAARARGVDTIAEIAGYGLSADGYHQTAPDPGGAGAARSMRTALAAAGHTPEDVDYVNGHGTGTPANDLVEPKAIKTVFADRPTVSSSKSMIGHTLGAAGVIEALCCVLAVSRAELPPTANAALDPPSGLDIIPGESRKVAADVALSNSFGFGGNNATVVVRRADTERPTPPAAVGASDPERVVITGAVGLAGSAGNHEALLELLDGDGTAVAGSVDVEGYGSFPVGEVDLAAAGLGIKPGVLRRMDPLGKLAAAAVRELHTHFGKPDRRQAERTGVLFATASGPISTVERFHRGVVDEGSAGADSRLFPNTVVNAAAGHVAVLNRFRGPTATMCSGSTSAISALHYAYQLVRRGEVDRILVLGADECPPELVAGYATVPGFLGRTAPSPFGALGRRGGTVLGAAAGAVLLQSATAAREEGATVLGEVTGFGLTGDGSGIAGLDPAGAAWAASFTRAMAAADLSPEQVGMVSASANGRAAYDGPEARALDAVGLAGRPIFAPKSLTGEVGGSASLVGLVAALRAFTTDRIPGNRNMAKQAPELPGLVGPTGRPGAVEHALLSSATPGGNYQTMAVSRWQK